MQTVSIAELEDAINIWRARHPSTEKDPVLCKPARVLADAYGDMIFRRAATVELNHAQAEAFTNAFAPRTA